MTRRNRCDWSQPCFKAEEVAANAVLASEHPDAERQWQREELARMIVGWERWLEDREAWRVRLEREWIPKVLENREGLPFNVSSYVQRIRAQLVPWLKS